MACIDCGGEAKGERCTECFHKHQAQERRRAGLLAAARKRQSERLKAAAASYERAERDRIDGLQHRLKAEAARRMARRAA